MEGERIRNIRLSQEKVPVEGPVLLKEKLRWNGTEDGRARRKKVSK